MILLQRYFSSQIFRPLVLSLTALAGLALLTQSLQTLDLIVENRQSAITFLKITLLALPQLIAIILPLSVFMSVLYALNRLHSDSELVVAKAAGFSAWQISSPAMRIAIYALIAHLLINLFVQPLSFRQMRAEILKVRTDIASQVVQEGKFVTPVKGLTVYARDIATDGQLKDILIYDAREDSGGTTHTAKRGNILREDSTVILSLENGNVQQELEDGTVDVVEFENYTLDLSNVLAVDKVLRLKTSDRFLHELLYPPPMEFVSRKIRREYLAEGHARLSSPLYNLALVLLALCFMVRGEYLRLGYGRRIAACAFIGFLIRLTGFGLASAAEATPFLNYLQYAFPTVIIFACFIYLARSKRTRKSGHKKRNQAYLESVETHQPLQDRFPDYSFGSDISSQRPLS